MNPNEQPKPQYPTESPSDLSPATPQQPEVRVANPTDTTISQVSHDYNHPVLDPPKRIRHPKRFMIALGIFVGVCILAVAAMVAIAFLPYTSSKKETTFSNTSTTTEKTVSAKIAIEHVKEHFAGYQVAKSSIATPVLATGKSFYTVVPDTEPLVSVAGEVAPDDSSKQLGSILASLTDDGFVSNDSAASPETTNYSANFSNGKTFCGVIITKPVDTKANQWFEIRCLDMATYVEYANAEQPLVSQYTPLSATSVQYGFVGKPTLVASKTSGYTLAELEVSIVVDSQMTSSGNYALFYQTPDGLWHYFRDRDAAAAFDCSAYSTDDLENAYAGVSCRNIGTNTTSVVEAPKKDS